MSIKTPEGIRELGAILFVGAHPDDEIWLAAGILAAAVRNGQRVACVSATKGEKGLQDETRWPRERIAQIRQAELEASLGLLGVSDHRWLDYPDGACDHADEQEAADRLRQIVREFRPDTILTFGPDGYTGHPDHVAVGQWAQLAVAGLGGRVLWAALEKEQYNQLRAVDKAANVFFKVDRPQLVAAEDLAIDLMLPPDLTNLKRKAFKEVPSQFEKALAVRPLDEPGVGLARECFVEAKKEA
jgi:LmbE family N-acetylglucosaminyl deacetylase